MKHDIPTSHPFWAVSYCHCTNFCFLFFLVIVIACFLIIPNFRFSSPIRFCGTLGRCWMSQPCVCGVMSSYRSKKKKKEIHQKKYISVFIKAFASLDGLFIFFLLTNALKLNIRSNIGNKWHYFYMFMKVILMNGKILSCIFNVSIWVFHQEMNVIWIYDHWVSLDILVFILF